MINNVAVPEDLYRQAAKIAAKDHVTINEFVTAAVANRLAGREYLESRAKLFQKDAFERALNEIPDVEPETFDRL